jgi:hypothetical protein
MVRHSHGDETEGGKGTLFAVVVDALKLTPANPSFIDARDAILRAAGDMLTSVNKPLSQEAYDRANAGIWAAFAKFGVGTEARSNGASLSGIVPSFKVPEQTTHPGEMLHFEADPNLAVPDNQPTGITSIINVPQDGKVAQIEVAVKIDHTYIGDLQVKLVSPEGDAVMLRQKPGQDCRPRRDILKQGEPGPGKPCGLKVQRQLDLKRRRPCQARFGDASPLGPGHRAGRHHRSWNSKPCQSRD